MTKSTIFEQQVKKVGRGVSQFELLWHDIYHVDFLNDINSRSLKEEFKIFRIYGTMGRREKNDKKKRGRRQQRQKLCDDKCNDNSSWNDEADVGRLRNYWNMPIHLYRVHTQIQESLMHVTPYGQMKFCYGLLYLYIVVTSWPRI